MKNGNDFLNLIFATLLLATAAAAPKTLAAATLHSHPMVMTNGSAKAMDYAPTSSTTTGTAKLLIFADDGQTAPDHQIVIRALGLNASDADQLVASVTERFMAPDGTLVYTDSYSCGDGNAGYIPSLTNYNFTTLVSKKVPSGRIGLYQFIISVLKYPGNNTLAVPYQTTTINIPSIVTYDDSLDSLHIDALQQIPGIEPIVVLTGHFPANVSLYYFVGSAPYAGGFSNQPSAISSDGVHLLIPGLFGSQMESRVILMMPDGSFTTTSAQAFIPAP